MKYLLFLPFFLSFFACENTSTYTEKIAKPIGVANLKLDVRKTRIMAKQAKEFCKKNNFNTQTCILIDMSLHSGLDRFVVWNFEKDTIIHAFPVAHGSGKNAWNHDYSKENPAFSNEESSHCSSLGKYRVGARAPSEWALR